MTYRITWVAIAMLFAGCNATHDPIQNMSPNWLRQCTSDRMCSDGLSCLCGVCTKTCGRVDDCATDPATTRCSAVSRAALSNQCMPGSAGDAEAICVAACAGDSDCKSSSGDFECRDQLCVVRPDAGIPHDAGMMRADAGRDASISTSDAGSSIPICELTGGCDSIDGGTVAGDGDAFCTNNPSNCDPPCTVDCKSGQMCLGNACADVLASDLPLPESITLDSSRVYWTNFGSRDDLGNYGKDGTIQAISLQGGEATTLASNRVLPTGIVVNSTHAYWLEGPHNFDFADSKNLVHDDEVWRVPLAGGDPERLLRAAVSTRGLAVDDHYVYLLVEEPLVNDDGPSRSGPGAVYRMPNDGAARLERLFSVDFSYGSRLFVDDTGLCWVGADPLVGAIGQVGTASKDGSDAHVLSKTSVGFSLMAVDASTIYWMGQDTSTINIIPRAGGDARVLTHQGYWQNPPEAIAVDRDYVYSAHLEPNYTNSSVERTDKRLGTSQVLVRTHNLAEIELAADDDAIYVLAQGVGFYNGKLLRVAKQ